MHNLKTGEDIFMKFCSMKLHLIILIWTKNGVLTMLLHQVSESFLLRTQRVDCDFPKNGKFTKYFIHEITI